MAIQIDAGGDGTVSFDRPTVYSDGVWHVYPPCSIQKAIDEANPGDTIFVHEGTYYEALTIYKPVKVIGAGATTTFINGTGVTPTTAGLVKITATYGEVEFSGFTVCDAPPVGAENLRVAIYSKSTLAGPTYIIQNNRIYGSNNPDEDEDYGFYAPGGKEKIVFRNNLVTQTGANPMLLECHTGPTEISYNTLDAGVWGCDAIFFMTYNNVDVTALQNVSYNTFNMGTGGPFDYDHRATAISFNVPGPAWGLGEAKFTNITIAGNIINNLQSNRRGIGFWNGGTTNNIVSPIVTGNIINGVDAEISWGIFFIGGPTLNALITYNTIKNVDKGVYFRTSGCAPSVKICYNNFEDNVIAINNTVGPTADARFNWWGDASGPTHSSNPCGTGGTITDNVDYSPWLGYKFETTPRTWHVNPTGAPGAIQEAINEASSGDTIIVHEGTYNEALYISKSITIKGASAPVIKGSGTFTTKYRCATFTREAVIFVVNATNVILENLDIEGEGLGPGCNDGVVYVYSGGEIRNCIVSPNTMGDMYSLAVEARASDLNIFGTTIKNFGRIGVYFANCTGGVYYSTIIGQIYSGETDVNYGIEIEPHQGVRGVIEIIGNEIYNSDNTFLPAPKWSSAGIVIDAWKEYMDVPSSTVIIQYNNIHNNYYGIEAAANALSYAHCNNIYNNREYGVISAPDYLGNNVTFDACYNWWGDPTGPYHPELNPSGKGNNVSDNVAFEPWLINPYPPLTVVETLLYVDPANVEYWTVSSGKTFTIEVKVANVTELHACEFKLYWDTTLLDLVKVQITPPWSNYFIAKNETSETLGRYWLSMTATGTSTFNGSTTLVKLTFKITYDPIYPQNKTCKLDLADTKLSAPEGIPIYYMTHDGEYTIYSTKPKIVVEPDTYTAHAFNEIFTVDITVKEVVNLYNFTFQLSYNTPLLDAIDLQIGPFLNPPIYKYKYIIDDANGLVWLWVWSQSPAPPASGSGILAKITFKVTTATTCTIYHPNILSCMLDLHNTLLVTNTGIEVAHEVEDGLYRYEPKLGDLDMDGHVGLTDLRILAYYYDPSYNSIADLNEDGKVDVYDLSILATHYGEDC